MSQRWAERGATPPAARALACRLARFAAPPRSALPVPHGDRRLSILGDPTARNLPEMPLESRKRSLSPSRRRQVRSRVPAPCAATPGRGNPYSARGLRTCCVQRTFSPTLKVRPRSPSEASSS